MKHLLRKGQIFKCAKFKDLIATLYFDGKDYQVNDQKLHFDYSNKVNIIGTEQGPDGWERRANKEVSLALDENMANKPFMVVSVALTGGGTGHGSHDVYPDGHYVIAHEVNGAHVATFYQTGCFIGMVDPKDIEWISGPADEEVKLKTVWEEA
jgi:hypothetical protein